jgi:hydrophobic/amphiphilic exporter-1 (mainly G- bacteria), HAE1 family
MKNTFIKRPILALVISIILVLLGLLALKRMPMTLFPSVAPPEVNVTVEYTGANAETVAKAAIVPLERAINGVPGMKYMSSDTGNDGVGVVQILFETGTNPDVAAINVQNRVNSVMGELPAEVIRNGVKIAKEENAMLLYLNVFSTSPDHDEKFLYNFTDINILAELKRIQGVGYADILGAKEYAMRVWLHPDKMIAFEVSAEDVIHALEEQNIEAAPGKIGENSDKGNVPLQYTVTYAGKFSSKEAYENIPVKSSENGEVLKMRDIADVEFGTTYFDVEAKFNGRPAASVVLKQLPGSNASEVIAAVKKRLAELKSSTFLPGMDYEFSFDVSRFLDAAVHEVSKTFLEAFLLVTLVVFLFLQDWRSTVIPAIAVPVSLVGTFFFIQFIGFSLNLITLFALVLAIGIVVDDAIVVVEAIHSKMEHHSGFTVREAAAHAMKDIGGAIVAITLVMASVFVPMAFLGGPSGIFYRQFSITMAVAIGISGLVALTLTPALSGLVLKHHMTSATPRSWLATFFSAFNAKYHLIERQYERLLHRLASRRLMTVGVLALLTTLSVGLLKMIPTGFIPQEDQGVFYASVTTPSGATLERTKSVVDSIQRAWKDEADIESISTLAGTNVLSDGTGASYGTVLVNLKPWGIRKLSVGEIIKTLGRKIEGIGHAEIALFPPPVVPGYGNASGFELRVIDKTGAGDFARMDSVVNQFLKDLRARPEIDSAFTIFNANYPQYLVTIDSDRAALKGVTINNAMGSLQTLLGSQYATNFIRFGQMYKVMVQAAPQYRSKPEDLLGFQVRSDRGEMVPLSAFTTLTKTHGVDQITRYNMYTSAELNGEGKAGVSSGTVIRAIQETAKEKLPKGFDIDWAGISRDEVNAGSEGMWVFLLCILFVYLVLSAQYESFVLPLSVLFSLPPGVFGALLLLKVAGLENNIYAHLALIMLVGLLGKNAILIVEYAEIKRKEGKEPLAAAIMAAKLRLRPILMTSLAFVAGLLPLVFSSGAGAVANRTIGTAAAGGMVIGTVLGVLLIPGLYFIFARRPHAAHEHQVSDALQPIAPSVEVGS